MTLPSAPPSHKLGPWTATALVVGNIIGVGVFMVPVSLAPYGWGSLLGWAVTLTGALCLAWVFATLSRHLPHAGGAMGIVREAFGCTPEPLRPSFVALQGAFSFWLACTPESQGGHSRLCLDRPPPLLGGPERYPPGARDDRPRGGAFRLDYPPHLDVFVHGYARITAFNASALKWELVNDVDGTVFDTALVLK